MNKLLLILLITLLVSTTSYSYTAIKINPNDIVGIKGGFSPSEGAKLSKLFSIMTKLATNAYQYTVPDNINTFVSYTYPAVIPRENTLVYISPPIGNPNLINSFNICYGVKNISISVSCPTAIKLKANYPDYFYLNTETNEYEPYTDCSSGLPNAYTVQGECFSCRDKTTATEVANCACSALQTTYNKVNPTIITKNYVDIGTEHYEEYGFTCDSGAKGNAYFPYTEFRIEEISDLEYKLYQEQSVEQVTNTNPTDNTDNMLNLLNQSKNNQSTAENVNANIKDTNSILKTGFDNLLIENKTNDQNLKNIANILKDQTNVIKSQSSGGGDSDNSLMEGILTETKQKIEGISSFLTEEGDSSNYQNSEQVQKLEEDKEEAESWLGKFLNVFTDFKDNAQSDFNNILADYNSLKNTINGDETDTLFESTSTTSCLNFNIMNKEYDLDFCKYLSPFSPLFHFIIVLSFMIITFRFMLNNLFRQGD